MPPDSPSLEPALDIPSPVTQRGARRRPLRIGGWHLLSLVLAVVVALPVLVIVASWLHPQTEIWRHLADTVLSRLLFNTLLLVVGVGAGVLVIGVGLAWLTAMCDFPGRRFFDWALMLPLAMPAYVLAFVALGLFDFTGPLQTLLREHFGPGGYWFPDIRTPGGVIAVMVLVFYPYVYMLARAAFLTQGRATLEAARVLGMGPAAFFHGVLPMARPAIAAGTALALMETLADFGAVSVFNYDTFTTAIYKAWFGLFSLQAASQLASLLLLFVALALISERGLRRRARFHEAPHAPKARAYALRGVRAWLACVAAGAVFFFAFLLPVLQLLLWAWNTLPEGIDGRYLKYWPYPDAGCAGRYDHRRLRWRLPIPGAAVGSTDPRGSRHGYARLRLARRSARGRHHAGVHQPDNASLPSCNGSTRAGRGVSSAARYCAAVRLWCAARRCLRSDRERLGAHPSRARRGGAISAPVPWRPCDGFICRCCVPG